jgi:hypothetical protein
MPEAPFGPPGDDGSPKAAQPPVDIYGTAIARLPAVSPLDSFRPRPATEDLRIPEQVRRTWALDELE